MQPISIGTTMGLSGEVSKMAKHNDYETPFYIRTSESATFQVDTLEEALEEFCGEKGYRLSLTAGDITLIIRRGNIESGQGEAHITITRRNTDPLM